jgi:hypothetical protein
LHVKFHCLLFSPTWHHVTLIWIPNVVIKIVVTTKEHFPIKKKILKKKIVGHNERGTNNSLFVQNIKNKEGGQPRWML